MTSPVLKVATNVVVPASAKQIIATFTLPSAATSYCLQATIAEATTGSNWVAININYGLDNANYPLGHNGPSVVGATAPWYYSFGENPIIPAYYVQLTANNTDSIAHTFTVWMLFK